MGNRKQSLLALASRFAHLALGAKEEDEDDKKKKSKEPCSDEEDGDGPDAAEKDDDGPDAAEKDDDDEDEDDEKKKAFASGRAAGWSAANDRWTAVLSSAEAKGRVPLACSLLADTDMNADTIRSTLLAAPAEGRQSLAARMASVPRPDVGSGPAAAPQPGTTSARVAEMKAAYDSVLGR